jgi:metal binding Ada-like protein
MPAISIKDALLLRSLRAPVLLCLSALGFLIAGAEVGFAQTGEDQAAKDRSSLPLQKALLGHWVIEKSGTHYYYSEGKFISVIAGKSHNVTYKIEEIDEAERKVRIKISPVHFRVLTFSPNKNEVSDIAIVANIKAEEAIKWKYVDDTKQPSPDVLNNSASDDTVFVITTEEKKPDLIVGDKKSKLYYRSNCPEYKKLPNERRVYFPTRRDAERAGYRASKDCF